MRTTVIAFSVLGLAFAGGAGYFAAAAVGQQAEPTRTVTVDVGQGRQGEPGPPGPPGPAGLDCIAGFSPAILRINHAGGQVDVFTCVED